MNWELGEQTVSQIKERTPGILFTFVPESIRNKKFLWPEKHVL
jgi:hypothetical protein